VKRIDGVAAFQITSWRFTNLREVTARSPKEVPGLSQATAFTACRASMRSVRGVTPSLLSDVLRPSLPCQDAVAGQAGCPADLGPAGPHRRRQPIVMRRNGHPMMTSCRWTTEMREVETPGLHIERVAVSAYAVDSAIRCSCKVASVLVETDRGPTDSAVLMSGWARPH